MAATTSSHSLVIIIIIIIITSFHMVFSKWLKQHHHHEDHYRAYPSSNVYHLHIVMSKLYVDRPRSLPISHYLEISHRTQKCRLSTLIKLTTYE